MLWRDQRWRHLPCVRRRATRAGGSSLRGISYGEVLAMAQNRVLLDERLAAALAGNYTGHLSIGSSLHAPYTVEPEGIADA